TTAPNGKNPWGDESSNGTDSTMKRVHDTPKTQLVPPEGPKDPLIGIQIGKQVAIKVLRPELAADPRQMQRLLNEARAVNAVRHPGLIDIFSFGKTPDGGQYFVMELLEGQSLEEMLHARGGKLKAWEALPILEGALA